MHRADKAVLRLIFGVGLAVLAAYGGGLQAPYVVCLMSVLVLCKPGPPLPLVKGAVLALLVAGLVAAGVVMVPLLEHYALSGVLLTAVVLYGLFLYGQLSGNALASVLVIAFAVIPVVGVADQALVGAISLTLGAGIATGVLVSAFSNALFPDLEASAGAATAARPPERAAAGRVALRAVVVVMPVFVLALTDPSFYLAAILKSVALGQQAGETDARSAGRELVGSTLAGAGIAAAVWTGLSLWPSLWMLVLWTMAAALWAGSGIFATRATAFRPSFWSNALTTSLILLGPAIEDSATGKGVLQASFARACLFVGVALYAWLTVWALERWHSARVPLPAVTTAETE